MSPPDFVIRKAAADKHFECAGKRDDSPEGRTALAGKPTRRSLRIAARRMTRKLRFARLELSRLLARRPPPDSQTQSRDMFGKKDVVEDLSRDLVRIRDRRDALTTDVTTLTARIVELEMRLAVETDRRERERVAGAIDGMKRRLDDTASAFRPAIAGLCDATETVAAVVPEAYELHAILVAMANEFGTQVPSLLRELVRRAEAVRAGHVAPQLPQRGENIDHRVRLVAWRDDEMFQDEAAESQRGTAT